MKKSRLLCAVFPGFFLLISSSNAALVNYNEASDGELDFASTTFSIDTAGVNSISGSSSQEGFTFDNDTFFFDLDAGLAITGLSLSFSNGAQQNIIFEPQGFVQELGTPTLLMLTTYSIATDAETTTVSVAPPYSFSNYKVGLGGTTFGGITEESLATFDWNVTIMTTAVPIPAAIWLFGSGLLGLVGMARRKKAA